MKKETNQGQPSTPVRRGYGRRILLIAGDLGVLLLFVYIGQVDHGVVNSVHPLLGLLASSWEFALVWLIAGRLLGAFPGANSKPSRAFLTTSLLAWFVTAPLAVLLRALVLSRPAIPTLFLAVTLVYGGFFLIGWRLLFYWGWRTAVRRR